MVRDSLNFSCLEVLYTTIPCSRGLYHPCFVFCGMMTTSVLSCTGLLGEESRPFPDHDTTPQDWTRLDWTGLGWAGLGWAGLGWAGLGWAGWAGSSAACFRGWSCHRVIV